MKTIRKLEIEKEQLAEKVEETEEKNKNGEIL